MLNNSSSTSLQSLAAACFLALAAAPAPTAHADFTVAAPFGTGMVVQQDAPVRLWGTGEPGGYVVARIAGLKKWGEPGEVDPFAAPFVETQTGATVNDEGLYCLTFDALPDAGHYEIYLSIGQEQIILEDVIVGQVIVVVQGDTQALAEGVEGLRVWNATDQGGAWDNAADGTPAAPSAGLAAAHLALPDTPVALIHVPSLNALIGPEGGLTVAAIHTDGELPETWLPTNEPAVVHP